MFAGVVLDLLYSKDIGLTQDAVIGCLMGAEMKRDSLQRQEQKEQAMQQEREYRDSLSTKDKLDYLVQKIRDFCFGYYAPEFFYEVLKKAVNGTQPTENQKYPHECLSEYLDGCNDSFRQEVLKKFECEVLPALWAKYNEEQSVHEATDELLALTNGKTDEEIRTMTATLKAVA